MVLLAWSLKIDMDSRKEGMVGLERCMVSRKEGMVGLESGERYGEHEGVFGWSGV